MLLYQNLQKALEEQISEIRRREGMRSLVCVSLCFSHWEGLGWTCRERLDFSRRGGGHRTSSGEAGRGGPLFAVMASLLALHVCIRLASALGVEEPSAWY